MLGDRLGLPVYVDNDANLGALAEVRLGAARGKQHVVYVRASHGVGGGLVLGGEVFHGRVGAAGEIGHTTIDDQGPICRCGNRGCLEMYVGAPVLLDMLRPSHGNLTLRDVIARAEDGRRRAADGSSPTPGATSASPPRACATCSTPSSWWSAASWRTRGRCCSSRCAWRSPSARSRARPARCRWSARSSAPRPRCAARSPWRSTRSTIAGAGAVVV